MKQYNFFLEASGGLTSKYLIDYIHDSGGYVVGSDIKDCAAKVLCDQFILLPKYSDSDLWRIIEKALIDNNIDIVIPSFDETLYEWAIKKEYFKSKGIDVIISSYSSIKICQDKWLTYNFFRKHNIPTPKSSLKNIYKVLKPKIGRGSKGIIYQKTKVRPLISKDYFSQEFISGKEYTVDIFCNIEHIPVYIIPRNRIEIIDGKSVVSMTENVSQCYEIIKKICRSLKFIGPINIQFIIDKNGEIYFLEINPRIAGGMSLGFKASENWINLIISNLLNKHIITPKKVNFNLKMFRTYHEVFAQK